MKFSSGAVWSACLAVLLGCSPPAQQQGGTRTPAATARTPDDHVHHHAAPHHGGLSELGQEAAHLEVTLDKASGRIDVYLLDGHAENAVRTGKRQQLQLTVTEPAELTVSLAPVADPLTGESEEATSRFQATVAELKGKDAFQGSIAQVEVNGQLYRDIKVCYPGGAED